MFTRQRDLSGNSLLKFKQTVRIEIQTVMVVAQLVAGLAELNGRLFQHIQDAGKLAVHAHQLADQLLRGIKLALQIGLFAVRQYRKGVLAGAEQLAAELAEARKDHRELIALVKGEGAAPEAAQPATTRKGNPGKKA